ncbi:spore germination protein GerPC [Paenibacillaceae bacterium WGS1546]|uniref:spore germination protein GerPC n=1 Tax=Cohnella sp. WGS1546 TaxID=3366810 RepID=UPI00372D7311
MQQPFPWNGAIQPPQPSFPGLDPNAPNGWNALVQRLCQAEARVKQLSERLDGVQSQLDEMKNKPPLHVEYHFDQLKINRLEGTLNVGLSPQGIQDIESLETPNPSDWKVAAETGEGPALPIRELQEEMTGYMDREGLRSLIALEGQFGIALGQNHRAEIVADVKRQLGERVHYYARTTPYPAQGTDDERRHWRDDIVGRTKRDIQGAFSAYLSKQMTKKPAKGDFPG